MRSIQPQLHVGRCLAFSAFSSNLHKTLIMCYYVEFNVSCLQRQIHRKRLGRPYLR